MCKSPSAAFVAQFAPVKRMDVLAPAEGLHAGPDHAVRARYSDFAICSCGGVSQICQGYRVCDAGALRAEPLGHPFILRGHNVWALSGAGKRTAASGVAWSGCASLRGPLCAGEALLEARTQASVALFKLGAHSATLRPEFGGPESLRCCCAKGVGHRAQLMLRARRGDGKNNHPVPLLRTPTPQSSLSPAPHTQGAVTRLPSP